MDVVIKEEPGSDEETPKSEYYLVDAIPEEPFVSFTFPALKTEETCQEEPLKEEGKDGITTEEQEVCLNRLYGVNEVSLALTTVKEEVKDDITTEEHQVCLDRDQEEHTESITNLDSPSNFTQENEDDVEDGGSGGTGITCGSENNNSEMQTTPSTSQSVSTAYITDIRNSRKRQQKDDVANEQRNFLKVCTEAITNTIDDTDVFGLYVGKRMKSIKNESQKMIAETLITQILQKAMLNKLTDTTIIMDQIPSIVLEDNSDVPMFSPSSNNSVASYFSNATME